MNSDIWKSSDTTEDDLQTISIVVNSTRTELQNGIRSLILQIGKLENKENNIPPQSKSYFKHKINYFFTVENISLNILISRMNVSFFDISVS